MIAQINKIIYFIYFIYFLLFAICINPITKTNPNKMATRRKSHTRRKLIRGNEAFQLKQVRAQNNTLVKTLAKRASSWKKAVADN